MADDARGDYRFGSRNQFLTDTPRPAIPRRARTIGGLTLSLSGHAAALLIAAIVVSRAPLSDSSQSSSVVPAAMRFVLPGGGGGGGGEPAPSPARRAQLVGRDALALPAVHRGTSERAADEPDPAQRIALPDPRIEAGLAEMVGAVSAIASPEFSSRGPGSGPGADGGRGPGSGPGAGPGAGPGDGPGSGGDSPYPGNGVSWPTLVFEVKPLYTADAMRARIEGVVELEIVVRADGSVNQIKLTRSLDSRFGLDEEAMKAVRGWRFNPARRAGKPVDVRVPVEVSFRLR